MRSILGFVGALVIFAQGAGLVTSRPAAAEPAGYVTISDAPQVDDGQPALEPVPEVAADGYYSYPAPRCRRRCGGRMLDKKGAGGYFNCSCRGSYKFPVPPQYTYFWPGMYSQQTMTEYSDPYRFPPLKLPPADQSELKTEPKNSK
jgi:hypothetical protein